MRVWRWLWGWPFRLRLDSCRLGMAPRLPSGSPGEEEASSWAATRNSFSPPLEEAVASAARASSSPEAFLPEQAPASVVRVAAVPRAVAWELVALEQTRVVRAGHWPPAPLPPMRPPHCRLRFGASGERSAAGASKGAPLRGGRWPPRRMATSDSRGQADAMPVDEDPSGYGFERVSKATLVIPSLRVSSSTSTARPSRAFSSPRMKTRSSGLRSLSFRISAMSCSSESSRLSR